MYGLFGMNPYSQGIDPNHAALQQRLGMLNSYGMMGGMFGSPYSFMPQMQMPGPFMPTATTMHPQMGGVGNAPPAPAGSPATQPVAAAPTTTADKKFKPNPNSIYSVATQERLHAKRQASGKKLFG